MATGTRATWASATHLPQGLIYPELVHGGMVETLVQNTAAFNGQSRNTIRLVTQRRLGDYAQESFWGLIDSLVSRRDPDSTSGATGLVVPKDEHISVKVNRKIGPIDQTFDSFRKVQQQGAGNLQVLSFLLGEQIAKAVQVDQLEAGLRSLVAALSGQTAVYEQTNGTSPGGIITTNKLVDTLARFGDAADRIDLWVMHSKVYYDLVKNQISANIDGVSNFNVAQATPVTLNRPVLITDSESLKIFGGSPVTAVTGYHTLGLSMNACVLEDSEEEMMYSDVITGNENIIARLQGEFAYNIGLKGFKWDVTNGGVNPANAALATSTNWDPVMNSSKDFAGVILSTD
jgi:hypothetical protein